MVQGTLNSESVIVERAIQERRTVRRFSDVPVGREVVERLLGLASMAPSPHNSQPWRFAVVDEPFGRRKLATVMANAWREDLTRDGVTAETIDARVNASVEGLSKPNVLIVVCLDATDLDEYPDETRRRAETTMGAQCIGAAIQNLLLGAHALGLGAGWRCAPLFCSEVVRSALGLPATWEPQALVLLGVPAQQPATPPRRPMSEMVRFLGGVE